MKTRSAVLRIAMTIGLLLILAGCSDIVLQNRTLAPPAPKVAISCIGVLPTQSRVDYDNSLSYKAAHSLEQGTLIMDSLLREELAGKEKIRFLNRNRLDDAVLNALDRPGEKIRWAAHKLGCNVILQVNLNRFQTRIGREYSVQRPAGAAFDYRLVEAESGTVLCRGEFDETQTSLLENLFTLSKASNRGFQWITAEQLLREGLREKLGECPYLPH